jgi:hypothetical protein
MGTLAAKQQLAAVFLVVLVDLVSGLDPEVYAQLLTMLEDLHLLFGRVPSGMRPTEYVRKMRPNGVDAENQAANFVLAQTNRRHRLL